MKAYLGSLLLLLGLYGGAYAQIPTPEPCPKNELTEPPSPIRVGQRLNWDQADLFTPQGGGCAVEVTWQTGNGVVFVGCKASGQYHCAIIGPHQASFTGADVVPGTVDLYVQGTQEGITPVSIVANGINFNTNFLVNEGYTQYMPLAAQ